MGTNSPVRSLCDAPLCGPHHPMGVHAVESQTSHARHPSGIWDTSEVVPPAKAAAGHGQACIKNFNDGATPITSIGPSLIDKEFGHFNSGCIPLKYRSVFLEPKVRELQSPAVLGYIPHKLVTGFPGQVRLDFDGNLDPRSHQAS